MSDLLMSDLMMSDFFQFATSFICMYRITTEIGWVLISDVGWRRPFDLTPNPPSKGKGELDSGNKKLYYFGNNQRTNVLLHWRQFIPTFRNSVQQ